MHWTSPFSPSNPPPPPLGMHWKGGRHHPLQGAQPAPSNCLPAASASLNGICNRPQPLWPPPPFACLTASGTTCKAPSLLMHPCPPFPPREDHHRRRRGYPPPPPPDPSPREQKGNVRGQAGNLRGQARARVGGTAPASVGGCWARTHGPRALVRSCSPHSDGSVVGGGGLSECQFFFDLLRKAPRVVFGP